MPPPWQIREAKGVGILICDHARGLIEDNEISANGRAGVAILSGGDPTVRGNKIHNGKDSGVLVSEKVCDRAARAAACHPRAHMPASRRGGRGALC